MTKTRITDTEIMARLRAKGITANAVSLNDIEAAWCEIKDERTPGWERFGSNSRSSGKVLNGIRVDRLERISENYEG